MTAASSSGEQSSDSNRGSFALGVDGGGTKHWPGLGVVEQFGQIKVLEKAVQDPPIRSPLART